MVTNSPATMVHSKLTELYLTLMNVFYEEATAERMIGKLFNFAMTLPPVITLNKHPVREKKKATSSSSSDIRELLASHRQNRKH